MQRNGTDPRNWTTATAMTEGDGRLLRCAESGFIQHFVVSLDDHDSPGDDNRSIASSVDKSPFHPPRRSTPLRFGGEQAAQTCAIAWLRKLIDLLHAYHGMPLRPGVQWRRSTGGIYETVLAIAQNAFQAFRFRSSPTQYACAGVPP